MLGCDLRSQVPEMAKFPKKYIKHGEFTLHSGQRSDTLYDVNEMLTDEGELQKILSAFPWQVDTCVGVATGGAIIASHMIKYGMHFVMVKDGELKGEIQGSYCLVDDVVTTEASIREALKIIADSVRPSACDSELSPSAPRVRKPRYIFVVVDRRRKKILKINSMFLK